MTSLSAGDSLRKGSTMTSADGQSKLVFQGDGNIVVCTTPASCFGQEISHFGVSHVCESVSIARLPATGVLAHC